MKNLLLSAAALAFLSGASFADDANVDPLVIDPVTGVEMLLSEIDISRLTEDQLADLNAQLAALDDVADGDEAGEEEVVAAQNRYRFETAHAYRHQAKTRTRTQDQDGSGAQNGSGRN